MVGTGVLIYGVVFTLALIFAIIPTITPVNADFVNLKFDQSEIPIGHSDVITIIDSSGPTIFGFEKFENGFGTWVNNSTSGVDLNDCWKPSPPVSDTPFTGPTTGANGTEHYLYYESSENCSPGINQNATLYGPVIDFDAFNNVQVQFMRHMSDTSIWGGGLQGDNMGRLDLEIQDEGLTTFTEVWSQERNQTVNWEKFTVDLSGPGYDNTGPRQLRFVATETFEGVQSDMAVDQITLQGDLVGPSTTDITSESFEPGTRTWVDVPFVDNNDCWTYTDLPTPTPNNGPSTGAVGTNWYVYYESSENCSPGINEHAILMGPVIDFDAYNNVQVQFWRHMLDTGPWGGGQNGDNMGKLALAIEDDENRGQFEEVWSQERSQTVNWEQFTVDLSGPDYDNTGQRRIIFNATETFAGVESDMAVDEITIRGTATEYLVNVKSFDSSTPPTEIESINVGLKKRGPNLYWQVVQFNDTTDEFNRQLEVEVGGTILVTDAAGNTNVTSIISALDGTINTLDRGLADEEESADCDLDNLGGDDDNDGICNHWEDPPSGGPMQIQFPPGNTYTMDETICNSFLQVDPENPVPCYGSDKRDIYVEIDYMVGHRPNIEALNQVIEAFDNAPSATNPNESDPIRLHIQLDTNGTRGQIEHQNCTNFPGKNDIPHVPSFHGFDQIKEVHFGTDYELAQGSPWGVMQKKQIFHYGLFVHSQCKSTSSGTGEVSGNDLLVSLGHFTGGIGNPDEQAGTFMHELGHNLNLHHGGISTDKTNCKPNHLSVMSYSRQFPILNVDRALDYSRQALGSPADPGVSLKEDALTEVDGIDTYDYNPNEGIVFGPIPPLFPPPTDGNIDWNGVNGDGETTLGATNLNGIPGIVGCNNNTSTDTHMGYNEWDSAIMELNPRDDYGDWADGRSAGAGNNPAAWEEDDVLPPNIVMSQTCPSIQQVLDWADSNVLGNATDPNSPEHESAKAKIKSHLDNYRTCEGGAGETNPLFLKAIYAESLAFSAENIAEYYGNDALGMMETMIQYHNNNPSEWFDQILQFFSANTPDKIVHDKLQFHYGTVNSLLDNNKSLEPVLATKLLLIKTAIESKAVGLGVNLNDTSEETIVKVEPIFAQDDLTTDSIKNMRKLRVDSMLQYLNNLDQSNFYEPKNIVIDYYNQSFVQIKNHIEQDSYAEAALVMANLDHVGKISNATTLEKVESASDTIIDQYTRAIPEFGTIASLILVAAITSIIILTTKTRNIFMPQNYQ